VGQESVIKLLAEKGFTDAEMAQVFDVTEQTFNNWKKQRPEFFESLKEWKLKADEEVERALFERAKGYSHPEDKIFNNNGEPLIIPTVKHYPPETAACVVWLANRQPNKWKKDPGESGGTSQQIADALTSLVDKLPS
jgi:DNA-binding XRE family transcriptional regulator